MDRYTFIFYFFFALSLAHMENSKDCGATTYYPSEANCYDGSLCPTVNGLPELKCGDECYSPLTYGCEANTTLSPLPLEEGPYAILVSTQDDYLAGSVINACNGLFYIGRPTCTYCPSSLGELCAASENITALQGRQGMQSAVPGGQRFYINPIGTLAYTLAHSAYIPGDSIVGEIQAFQDGGFVYAEGGGWYACPVHDPGTYVVVNLLHGVVIDEACMGINIVTKGLSGGPFAWQYT